MFLSSKQSDDPDENQMFPDRKDSMRAFPVICFLLNVAIGTGVVKLGTAYKAGAILSPLLSTIIAIFSTYSFYLFLKAAMFTKSSTFEEIWAKTYGRKTVIVCAAISMLSKLMALKAYTSFVYDSAKSLILQFYPEAPVYLTDKYVLLAIVFVVFYIPTFCSKKLMVIAVISYVKVFCLMFLCVVMIYWFGYFTAQRGFDPSGQIAWFRFDNRAVSCLDSLLTAYLIMPMCYPGLRHFERITVKKFMRIYMITMVICWVVYNIVGEICYFTFFDLNTGGLILDYYGDNTLNTVSRCALLLMMIYTCPVALNPVRFVLINLVAKSAEFPAVIWATVGISVSFVAIVLTSITGDVNFYIGVVTNIRAPFVLFIFPAMLYLKAFGRSRMLHFVCAILILLLGLGSVCFVLWLPFS